MGNIIGTTIKVADPEDDGVGCEFLQVRFSMNITKSLVVVNSSVMINIEVGLC